MAPINLFIASLNFTQADNISSGIYQLIADRSLIISGASDISEAWYGEQWMTAVIEWLSRPDILAIITAWWITFTIIMTLVMTIGFGPGGIVAGSLAAAFQSFMYGAFTPAGGIFATFTSMAMLGTFLLPVALLASVIATGVAVAVWRLGWRFG